MKPNKEILRMQQLAGLITESEIKQILKEEPSSKILIDVFSIISNALDNLKDYTTHQSLKYHFVNRGHDTTDDEQKAQYDKIVETPLHIILQNPEAYDWKGDPYGDAMKLFSEPFSKYKSLYQSPSESNIKNLNEEDLKDAFRAAWDFLKAMQPAIRKRDIVGQHKGYQISKNEYAEYFQRDFKKLENLIRNPELESFLEE